jgi:hypothetical protein
LWVLAWFLFVRAGLCTFATFKLHWLEKELHQQELDDDICVAALDNVEEGDEDVGSSGPGFGDVVDAVNDAVDAAEASSPPSCAGGSASTTPPIIFVGSVGGSVGGSGGALQTRRAGLNNTATVRSSERIRDRDGVGHTSPNPQRRRTGSSC